MDLAADAAVEAILTEELARETRALTAVVPVLRHLLSSEAQALVSDAVLARVRGMIHDLAAQLLALRAGSDPAIRLPAHSIEASVLDPLAEQLMADEALLAHCHALAAESLIAERLQTRHAVDPVLSPLLQELIAAEDPAIASLAMATLAGQSRFVQSQRRMELPLAELPAELFHRLLAGVQSQMGDSEAATRLQAGYDEAAGRLGLLARLVAAMRRGAVAALGLDHAGVALFASALAAATRQPRAGVVLACLDGQGLRLALLLRAGGVDGRAAERQVMLADPNGRPPRGLAEIAPAQAEALLAGSGGGR
ncbi:hypothetical protein [Erythrobacter sp. BLCC-B19]|uniref:hypothetical protein n=1 Tax=Erythrobacter sp. BLCC-B19 TaxID=3025315 RepID=UPI00235E6592|nr:hypothetical protein [Erythrobacter sp. BLCC-B19]WDA40736.1 hypothetical protein PS060_14375 [Erythrobacter sp. BLCC-B19]